MKNLPFISCKCITYGRIDTLEEAIHSFLIQEYEGKKEMIIVNDYPLQRLKFDHPEIKIFNLDNTFSTIGEKENFAIEKCEGELIAVFDDDDVALSNHLSNIAEWWEEEATLLHWANGIYYNEPNITSIGWIGNSGIVYSKEAWNKIGKSPIENAGGDTTLVRKLHGLNGKIIHALPSRENVSWFYMWGGRGYHQSGQGHDVPGQPNIIERHSAYIESLRKKGEIKIGDINLIPRWRKDYKKMLEEFIKN